MDSYLRKLLCDQKVACVELFIDLILS